MIIVSKKSFSKLAKDKIDQVEKLDKDHMETLFMVIKSLNDRGRKYTT